MENEHVHIDRIAVPPDCPCDFRYAGIPPVVQKCRCGREIGSWLACPEISKMIRRNDDGRD